MILNPMCDLPEEIYKDFLADQGFDELRDIPFCSLIGGIYCTYDNISYIQNSGFNGSSEFILFYINLQYDDVTHCLNGSSLGGWNELYLSHQFYCSASGSGDGFIPL